MSVEIEWKRPQAHYDRTVPLSDIPHGTFFSGHIDGHHGGPCLFVKGQFVVTSLDGQGLGWGREFRIAHYRPVNIRIIVDAERPA